jgi:hypothetical protein|tara:strand:+ start:79 stop:267 length:189 start_codon:yes stop_codon:yes gene_type:complete
MKDTIVEQHISNVVMLTAQINNICKELRKENVTLKFDINHSMSEDNIIAVGEAIQRVDYLEK